MMPKINTVAGADSIRNDRLNSLPTDPTQLDKEMSVYEDGVKIEVQSSLAEGKRKVVWTIVNFNKIPFFIDKYPVPGPVFSLGKQSNTWQLVMSKQLDEDKNRVSLGFRLVRTEDNDFWSVVRYSFSIKSGDDASFMENVGDDRVYWEVDSPYRYMKYIGSSGDIDGERSEDGSERNGFEAKNTSDIGIGQAELKDALDEGVLIVECDIEYRYIGNSEKTRQKSDDKLLVDDCEKFSDVLLCAGNMEFPAHMNILRSRARGFDSLLEQEKKPCGQRLQLDLEESVARALIWYIYTGEFPEDITADDCYRLYRAAEKYSVNHLTDNCVKYLKDKSKASNVCN